MLLTLVGSVAVELILTMTYVVVAFSIIVQGLTVRLLLIKTFGLAGQPDPHTAVEG